MSERYPPIRIHAASGSLVAREGLHFAFYMRHPHEFVAPGAMRALEAYLRVVGDQALGRYADEEGELRKLDGPGWERVRREMHADSWAVVRLYDAGVAEYRYRFEYHGRQLVELSGDPSSEVVSEVNGWLPTEFLEEHGPERVRALALEMAAALPLCSGHMGLSFNGGLELVGVKREVLKHAFRHPGIDIPENSIGWRLGTRIWGTHWLTFLGLPVLGELGGVAGLSGRLHAPGTTVQDIGEERVVITLGDWPEAGDTEQGGMLPAYREVARVLEPWLYQEERVVDPSFSSEQKRRWERRFLD